MQADRCSFEFLPDCAGQHVLAAVLFHMICPPRAVNLSAHIGTCRDFLVYCVDHFPVCIHFHIRNLCGCLAESQRTCIKGLSARSRIERAPVQGNFPFPWPCSVLQ